MGFSRMNLRESGGPIEYATRSQVLETLKPTTQIALKSHRHVEGGTIPCL